MTISVVALKDVDIEVRKGDFVALMVRPARQIDAAPSVAAMDRPWWRDPSG